MLFEHTEETGSTNADLIERLSNGEALGEGFWYSAARQTGGRGRLGREWSSPEGNLFCSTIVRVRDNEHPLHTLSLAAGLACHETCKAYLPASAALMLKWPNDVLVDNAKLAGILIERSGDALVVGIGVNVEQAPEIPDRATTALRALNPRLKASAKDVLQTLAQNFGKQLQNWRSAPLSTTLDAWMCAAHPAGTPVAVGKKDNRFSGSFAGLDAQGSLLLRLADGTLRTIHAGDVTIVE